MEEGREPSILLILRFFKKYFFIFFEKFIV
nr:MAG TPA: hypothetical protein [Caudoviricetes sp.]